MCLYTFAVLHCSSCISQWSTAASQEVNIGICNQEPGKEQSFVSMAYTISLMQSDIAIRILAIVYNLLMCKPSFYRKWVDFDYCIWRSVLLGFASRCSLVLKKGHTDCYFAYSACYSHLSICEQ